MKPTWLRLATLVVVTFLLPAVEPAHAGTPDSNPPADCQFQLGFAALRQKLGGLNVGDCTGNEVHDPTTGDGFQITTNGMLLWRKVDNLTAFWDGQQAWVVGQDGPSALAEDVASLVAGASPWVADAALSRSASAVTVSKDGAQPPGQSATQPVSQSPQSPAAATPTRQPASVARPQSDRVASTSKKPVNQGPPTPHTSNAASAASQPPAHPRSGATLVCSPRPPVSVQTAYGDPGVLVVNVSTAAPPLSALRFEAGANASVEIPPDYSPRALPFTLALSSGVATASFEIHQLTAGTAATISRLVVIDGCGEWPTFTGGGPNAYAVTYQTYGLDFSPYIYGQDPNRDPSLTAAQVLVPLSRVASYTRWVRSFSCASGLSGVGQFAHQLGLKAAVGAWIGPSEAANQQQLACLITAIQNGQADLAIVGSEVLLRQDRTEAQLLAYINQVKQAAPSATVTTADVYSVLLAHPNVMSAVGVVFANYYPYWEGVRIDRAVAALNTHHQDVLAAAGGKPVYVSETGWPSCGNSVDQATPSPANASTYFLNFTSWAQATHTPFFYFEALDEPWKAAYEGPQGACWGFFDTSMHLKPGMAEVFHGQTVGDNWTLIGGPGTPALTFTSVPAYGTFDPLVGDVWHVSPRDYQVVVYIQVNGGWWIKPTAATPITPLGADGRWSARVTSGGVDQNATHITGYLIPKSYSPPILLGASTLPPELDQRAAARADASRTPANTATRQP